MKMNYRKCSQDHIDSYWNVLDDDRRISLEALVSRNVVKALLDAEAETNLSIGIQNWQDLASGKSSKPELIIDWAGVDHPSGRDVLGGKILLKKAVDEMVNDHLGGGKEKEYLELVAKDFESLAKRIRRRIK